MGTQGVYKETPEEYEVCHQVRDLPEEGVGRGD